MSQEPRTIYPVILDADDEVLTDFRPMAVPADAPEEEEEGQDPKDESAPAPANSLESPRSGEPPAEVTPVPPPAAKVTSPPRVQSPGS